MYVRARELAHFDFLHDIRLQLVFGERFFSVYDCCAFVSCLSSSLLHF